jgi:hypothetical protein
MNGIQYLLNLFTNFKSYRFLGHYILMSFFNPINESNVLLRQAMTVPIGYKNLQLPSNPTLQLKDLLPGLYQFKLTVTDSDGATNSTIANVTVLKEIDYPPTANAGPDVVIHLPQNEVTLYGNQSTDDKVCKLLYIKLVFLSIIFENKI